VQAIGYVVALLFIGGMLALLWSIVRFSLISRVKTGNAQDRLRHPDPAGVEKECGIDVPAELADLYTTAPFVERFEFELVDGHRQPPRVWPIGQFIPLSPIDAREWRVITRAPGVPLATDLDKGVYFLNANGQVWLDSPNIPGRRALVASTVAALRTFTFREIAVEEE
jgi:hypothetical protein